MGKPSQAECIVLSSEENKTSIAGSIVYSHVMFNKSEHSAGIACMTGVKGELMMGMLALTTPGRMSTKVEILYSGEWQAVPSFATAQASSGHYLTLNTGKHTAGSLCSSLGRVGACTLSIAYRLQPGDCASIAEYPTRHTIRLLEVIQGAESSKVADFHLVTSGGMHVDMAPIPNAASTIGESAAQGFLRTVAAEFPLIAVCSTDCSHEGMSHSRTPASGSSNGLAQVQRLFPSGVTVTWGGSSQALHYSGLYILSGGLGSLGLMVCDWLLSHEEGPVWLLGRRGHVAVDDEAVTSLWQKGACVSAIRCDSSMSEEASSLVPQEVPLRGFVHAAGISQNAIVTNQTPSHCRSVIAPKVPGLCNMQVLMQLGPLDTLILFSSSSSQMGIAGQSNYTAANAALDAAAALRQAQGGPGNAVQWGAFAEVGMAARHTFVLERMQRLGYGLVTPDMGLAVLASFMGAGTQAGVMVSAPQVGFASPVVWATCLKSIGNPGIYNAFEECLGPTKLAQGSASERPRGKKKSRRTISKSFVRKSQKEALC